MRVGVIGVNCHCSDLETREVITRAFLQIYEKNRLAAGAILLSTCNRSELYFADYDLPSIHSDVLEALRLEIPIPFEDKLYSFFEKDAFVHLSRTAAGLDSAIVAETEIQGQVKNAYIKAINAGRVVSALHFIFQKSLQISKRLRTLYPLTQGMPGLAEVALELGTVRSALGKVLFVGNSEMNRKLIHYFKKKGVGPLFLSTRFDAPTALAQVVSAEEVSLWHQYEMVVLATDRSGYLIPNVREEVKTKLVLDLSLPRSVDPRLMGHPGLILKNIEQMAEMVADKRQMKMDQIAELEGLVRLWVQEAQNSRLFLIA